MCYHLVLFMREEECRLVMQKECMAEVRDITHPGTLKEYISMKIVVTITTEAVVMAITDKSKSTEFFSAFAFLL